MKLEWFRTHQKIVFWVITPLLVFTFAFFFGTDFQSQGDGPVVTGGNSGEYQDVSGQMHYIDTAQMNKMRRTIKRYYRIEDQVSSAFASEHIIRAHLTTDLGLDIGPDELRERMREHVRERTGRPKVTTDVYNRYLDQLNLTESEFEKVHYEMMLYRQRFHEETACTQARATQADAYLKYCSEKQSVRLLYREIKSRDFLAKVEKADAGKVQARYEELAKDPKAAPAWMKNPPSLAAEVLYLPESDVRALIKPEEKDLKSFYDRTKTIYYQIDEKQPPEEKNLKPYEQVKDDVRTKYIDDQVLPRKSELMAKVMAEYKGEAVKAKEAGKPVDLAAFAKKHGLIYWKTKQLTEDQFRQGAEKAQAEDFKPAAGLFTLLRAEDDPEQAAIRAKRRHELQTEREIGKKPERGWALMRIPEESFEAERLKSPEEAAAEIEKHLAAEKAVELAGKAAEDLYKDWLSEAPAAEKLSDKTFTPKDTNALAGAYFKDPKPIGEVLKMVSEADPANKPGGETHAVYALGFAVEHTVPAWTEFQQDAEFDREQARLELAGQFVTDPRMRQMFAQFGMPPVRPVDSMTGYLYAMSPDYLKKLSKIRITGNQDPNVQ